MYLHLGSDYLISKKQIVGIFDLDATTVNQTTRDFLTEAQKEGQVEDVGENLPKSFVICTDTGKKNHYTDRVLRRCDRAYRQKLIISPLASTTLRKRNGENPFTEE